MAALFLIFIQYGTIHATPSLVISRVWGDQSIDISPHLYVLPDVSPSLDWPQIRYNISNFRPYHDIKDSIDAGKINWAMLRVHNDGYYPIDWVLTESHETSMKAYFFRGAEVIGQQSSGQLVPIKQEELPQGKSWEARFRIRLAPGESQLIFFHAQHAFGFSKVFDFSVQSFDQYQHKIQRRNLQQNLFQGAIFMIFLILQIVSLIQRDRTYFYLAWFCALQALHFQYFFGLSKEWFWLEYPVLDLAFSGIPILLPLSLFLLNDSLFASQDKRSTKWRFAIFTLVLLLIYNFLLFQFSTTQIAFRMANVFVLLSPIALWLMLKEYISGAKFEQKLFLYGSISFSLLAVISVISFVIDESLAGAILQIGTVLHIIIFVVGLSYH
ncbi:MAG: 7TM diverse intracellular signaling domain-containing protein, partial [Bacteroidota bacterium]